jgi:hypothetical protein
MISDANATRSDEEHAAALIAFIQSFGDVRSVSETLELIRKGAKTEQPLIMEAASIDARE